MLSDKRYPPQDPIALGHHYHAHVNALTTEGLNGKAEIAEQLAWRDQTIEGLRSELANARALLAEISTLYRQEHEQIAPLLAAAVAAKVEPQGSLSDAARVRAFALEPSAYDEPQGALRCNVASENTLGHYTCTREQGHEGPCAAVLLDDASSQAQEFLDRSEARHQAFVAVTEPQGAPHSYAIGAGGSDDGCSACGAGQHEPCREGCAARRRSAIEQQLLRRSTEPLPEDWPPATSLQGAPPPACGSMSADPCVHGNMARRCRGNR